MVFTDGHDLANLEIDYHEFSVVWHQSQNNEQSRLI